MKTDAPSFTKQRPPTGNSQSMYPLSIFCSQKAREFAVNPQPTDIQPIEMINFFLMGPFVLQERGGIRNSSSQGFLDYCHKM